MATTTRVLDANVNGTVYTTNANDALEAIDTCHSGATAPTDEVANGKLWLDTSTSPGVLKVYNNATWEPVGKQWTPGIDDQSNSTAITINSLEKVGIGTTSPSTALEVFGASATAIRLTRSNAVSNYAEVEVAGGNSEQLTIKSNVSNQASGFTAFDMGGSEAMRIDASGQLGIGTISPSSPLEVVGSGQSLTFTGETSGATGGSIYKTSTGVTAGIIDVSGTSGDIQIKSDPDNVMANSNIFMQVDGVTTLSVEPNFLDVTGDVTLGQTGTTTTGERRLAVRSLGYAVLELAGDRGDTSGEPGGAGMTVGVDGTTPNGVVSFVNAAGTDGVGGTYTGTGNNTMLVGTITNSGIDFGINGVVVANFGTAGVLNATFAPADVADAVASRSVGNIGTYAFLRADTTTTPTSAGTTVTGSTMRYADANFSKSGTPNGTWQCMGYAAQRTYPTVYLRIS